MSEEREDRPVEAPDIVTSLSERPAATSASDALHGSGPAPPPQTDHHENYLFYILKEYLKDEHPEQDAPPIEKLEKIPQAEMARLRGLLWVDSWQWRLNWIRRRVKLGGYLLFGLSLGLADSVMQWGIGGAFNCYQFPYYSFIGCLDVSHSWEVVFILLIVAAGMIGA